jgi:hypothetical protein
MAISYCTEADLYSYGLPRGALSVPGRLIDSVDVSANTFELDGHGFAADGEVEFRAVGGGSLPSPLAEGVTYYVIAATSWRFQVSASSGGAAVNLSTAGTTFLVLASAPVAATIAKVSRRVDDMLVGHPVPLSAPVPDVIRMTTAELAAAELLALTGGKSESLTRLYDAAERRVVRWARNAPLRGENAPATAQHSATSAASTRSESSWRKYGGIA